jgi:NAD(P)H-flavin reductase/ferredoxin
MTMHRIEVKGDSTFRGRVGQKLLDAALLHGVHLPHDCRSGRCGTCRVKVVDGRLEGGQSGEPGAVLACQAQICGPVSIEVEPVPPVDSAWGVVEAVNDLRFGVVEVVIQPSKPIFMLAGQYMRVQFRGVPGRCYSPTVPLDGPAVPGLIRIHVRRVRGGLLSNAFGKSIRPGHKVKLKGPFGSAFYRHGHTGRLILVGTGTGFAPIWSVAHQALVERPDREMVVLAGARSPAGLYMVPALERLIAFPRVSVIPIVSETDDPAAGHLVGSALDFLPILKPTDTVYAGGSPDMVASVMQACQAAGAVCHADAFEPLRKEVPEARPMPRADLREVIHHILSQPAETPQCVLVSSVEGTAGQIAVEDLAAQLSAHRSVALVHAAQPLAARAPSRFTRRALLPFPGHSGLAGHDWPARTAREIEQLSANHHIVLISVPPMSESPLAWVFSAVASCAVLITNGGVHSSVAAHGIRAQGIKHLFEVSENREPLRVVAA